MVNSVDWYWLAHGNANLRKADNQNFRPVRSDTCFYGENFYCLEQRLYGLKVLSPQACRPSSE